jgi:putative restriction endonuclease
LLDRIEGSRVRTVIVEDASRFARDLVTQELGGCAVTGCSVGEVLRASHIKPWKYSNNHERLDRNNGLLLTATLDVLFDRGLISFDDDGALITSPRLRDDQVQHLLTAQPKLQKGLSLQQKKYLKVHRKERFLSS